MLLHVLKHVIKKSHVSTGQPHIQAFAQLNW